MVEMTSVRHSCHPKQSAMWMEDEKGGFVSWILCIFASCMATDANRQRIVKQINVLFVVVYVISLC